MRFFLIIIFFIISIVILGTSFLAIIAPLKEGLGPEYIGYYCGLGILFLSLLVGWFYILKNTADRLSRALGALVIMLVVFCLLILLLLLGNILYREIASKYFSAKVKLNQYEEKLIEWPGFSHPVGLTITLEIEAPFYTSDVAGFYPPLIWQGPGFNENANVSETQQIYFSSLASIEIQDHLLAMLKQPVFSKEEAKPVVNLNDQKKRVTYNLYPGVIEYFESANAFCLYSNQSNPIDIYANYPMPAQTSLGSQISALWFYAGHTNVLLSGALTQLMRQHSQLENNAELWQNMHNQFNEAYLLQIGYQHCSLASRKHCFCR